jgi:TonB-dependent receptor
MVSRTAFAWIVPAVACVVAADAAFAQPQAANGSIRGVVMDRDFGGPIPGAQVLVVETGARATAGDQGEFLLADVPAGRYTLIFSKDGFVRQIVTDVGVVGGQVIDVDADLAGEFTDMDEFVVQDVQLGGSEAGLLRLRLESPALMDSVSAEVMSRAGFGDAASALRLIPGATVQDGKFAVIRGLPTRYVSSQINGVRLPSADEDTRSVQLDQFPSAIISSIQVSKTFTPDQQGDASGGAVNVILKGLPEETIFSVKGEVSYNTNVRRRNNFLTYDGGGVGTWGDSGSEKDQQLDNLGQNWDGAAGVSEGDAPTDYKWSASAGSSWEIEEGLKVGGLANFFYERDSSFFDDGIDDGYWVTSPGAGMTPETTQGTPQDGDFKTKLFDVTQGSQSVQWGGLGTLGLESENNEIALTYLYTRTTEDVATLAEDTRGKAYFFPGYDPTNPAGPGNQPFELTAAPYLRLETLEYTERETGSIQLRGKHTMPFDGPELGDGLVKFLAPEFDWTAASSFANQYQPDKRQFGSLWQPASLNPGFPPFIPPFSTPAIFLPYKPAANFTLGNFQRIWKDIEEDSEQYQFNLKLPFELAGNKGYVKTGYFDDTTKRSFDQDTFSNFNDPYPGFEADFSQSWSQVFPTEPHPITAGPPFVDVDYKGEQKISAWYAMADVPLASFLNIIGGARVESTELSIVNNPEENATWFPPGAIAPVALQPGDADVDFSQDDVLPSIGMVLVPAEKWTFRAAYSETIARQTFKELTPIQQQEYLGADIFIGNPDLEISSLQNYDLRLDYAPFVGSLASISWFYKDIEGPIEYVQRIATGFTYTTPVNYPSGELYGFEVEGRLGLGNIWEDLQGLSVGANATFLESSVNLPEDEIAGLSLPNIQAPVTSRDMTGAPEYLYNLYATWDSEETGTQVGLFYSVQGDTLIAGAGESNGNYVPNVYARRFGTLNFSISQKLGQYFKLQFAAKNLLDPEIEEVYRSPYIERDVLKTSFTRGIEFAVGLTAEFKF